MQSDLANVILITGLGTIVALLAAAYAWWSRRRR